MSNTSVPNVNVILTSHNSNNFETSSRETDSNDSCLGISPIFCPVDISDPFDSVQWAKRTAVIKGDNGSIFFEQNDCEFPESWSQLSINVVASKYFYGEPNTPAREKSVRQIIHRVSRTIADWGLADGYFANAADAETYYRDLTWLLLNQYGSFNSPVWFNVGLYPQYGIKGNKCTWHWDETKGEATQPENPYQYPQASACFIQSVEDNMEAIMDLARSEAMLFKFGSGTGTDLSTIRSSTEKLTGGGKPSGPLSFMRVYDQIAAVVKSGGKTRRAAKMQSLKVTHPDIMDFIDCKFREEKKAKILMENGFAYEDAYSSVLFQNANLSVRLTDEFMQAVKADDIWTTRWVTDPNRKGPEYPAREVFDKISSTAWACGDPGVQFDTIINRWHTTPNSGRINASNPCSEYMSLDDTACNLASINLMKFRNEDGTFDAEKFVQTCRIFFIAQEIIVDRASYPIKKIAENSHKFRAIGLGYTNLGSLIMSLGLPYDSDEARGLCSVVTALMNGAAYKASAELAGITGTFETFNLNREPMLKVIDMHWNAVNNIANAPNYLKRHAQKLWDEVRNAGSRDGFRNAQTTVLAPTGTISFMMDCDTTGIEPDIAIVKFKQLAGGGTLRMVNRTVPLALRTLGYSGAHVEEIVQYIEENGMISGAPHLVDAHLPVFDCAFPSAGSERCISWQAHVKMMAAAQPFISGAISKTVNLPNSATVQDIADAYMLGWELGLKSIAVYRDGSKGAQPLSTSNENSKSKETDNTTTSETRKKKKTITTPRRERLPDTRQSVTHKFSVSGHEGYITVGLYPDGRVGELFITMAKEGSTIGGLMDCFGTAISMSLQYGVPLNVYIEKFSHTRFEPLGMTKNPDIPIAKSLVDYIFRWLGRTFMPEMPSVLQDPQNHNSDFNHNQPHDHIHDQDLNKQHELNKQHNPNQHQNQNSHHQSNEHAKHELLDLDLHERTKKEHGVVRGVVGYDSTIGGLQLPEETRERRCGVAGKADIKTEVSSVVQARISQHVKNSPTPIIPTTPAITQPTNRITPHLLAATASTAASTLAMSTTKSFDKTSPITSTGTAALGLLTADEQYASFQSDAPLCDACGAISVRSGNCYLCHNCGKSMGCS
ncbi:MAG: vitamin B12-dependent ribonucleotide reductase [Planctomycetaceae bacterium]|jgi:ribonucleoside-diphosphate reductase alpha chain|nr:vitamin B12-dependent ribonucleotide reductase [Planctomycetaceae bacterium]